MHNLTQDLALLDLVSHAKTTAGSAYLQRRAHHLAEVHQIATPVEVDQALATLTPHHQVYAWDRPATLAERDARHLERQRLQAEAEAQLPKGRWYHKADGDVGMLMGGALSAILSWGGVAILTMTPGPFEISAGDWVFWAFLLPPMLLVSVGGFGFGALHDRWQSRQAPARAHRQRCDTEDAREQSFTPTAKQAERWLAFPEVADQARSWMSSEIGLLVEDARRLDARAAELAKTAHKDREAQALAQLQAGLARPIAQTEGACV